MSKKILLIDDEEALRKVLERHLRGGGYSVISAADGSEGRLLAKEARPDLILTDADMPGLDGHALCRVLKQDGATRAIPVILMSGRLIGEHDQIEGLRGGADDYLLKPVPARVLLAKIEAVLRRYAGASESVELVRKAGIELDPGAREVSVRGRKVALTRKEFDLLALFLERAGRVLSARILLESVWGYDPADYNDPHTVESHVSSLRRKLGKDVGARIVNHRGVGYKFELE